MLQNGCYFASYQKNFNYNNFPNWLHYYIFYPYGLIHIQHRVLWNKEKCGCPLFLNVSSDIECCVCHCMYLVHSIFRRQSMMWQFLHFYRVNKWSICFFHQQTWLPLFGTSNSHTQNIIYGKKMLLLILDNQQ